MSETDELMVKFQRGVSEEDARAVVVSAGATVRRKMRTDHADEVMLLVRAPTGKVRDLEKQVTKNKLVTYTEINQGGFKAL